MTPKDFREYFSKLAATHGSIKQFFYGDFDDIIEAERNNIDYPLMWLESPEINLIDDDELNQRYDFSFLILMAAPLDDKERNMNNQFDTYNIMEGIIRKLVIDAEADVINMDKSIEGMVLQPVIRAIGNNNETGWRLSMSLYGYFTCSLNVGEFGTKEEEV